VRTLQTPRSVKEEGEEVLQLWSRSSPADCAEDHNEAGCPTAAHDGADIHLQTMDEPIPEQVDAQRRL